MGLDNFTAIDVETATGSPASICQVGLVRVQNGEIVQELCLLVQPPGNEYWGGNIRVHGIRPADTARQPTFAQLWPQLQLHITGQLVVAHNIGFDDGCLKGSLRHYGLAVPRYRTDCTLRLYRRQHYGSARLSDLCTHYDIPLTHHNALSDARACATLYLRRREWLGLEG